MTKKETADKTDPIKDADLQFDEIFDQHQSSVYRFACYLTQNHHEAEDLYQETWFRVVKTWSKINNIENIQAWIFKIMMNFYRDNLRKKRIRKIFFHDERLKKVNHAKSQHQVLTNQSGSITDESDRVDLGCAIAKAIENLPKKVRQVFILKEIEGFKHQEISRILRIPAGTTKSLLYRATRRLQSDLEEYWITK